MAIIIHTNYPHRLLSSIKEKILNGESDSWKLDADGDFTYSSSPYEKKAWLHVVPKMDNELIISLLGRKDEPMTKETYAFYHCQFAEFILCSFDTDISYVNITSMPTTYDVL